jgi:hypothetical protein
VVALLGAEVDVAFPALAVDVTEDVEFLKIELEEMEAVAL